MTDQYYIRIRGQSNGPFDSEKLRTLARRGQFSRMHEVSNDGVQWTSARDYPEFFQAPTPVAQALPANGANTQAGTPHSGVAAAAPPPDDWFFQQAGATRGPIDQAGLVAMIVSGQLASDTEIWKEGMSEWVPASRISGFLPAQNAGQPSGNYGVSSSKDQSATIAGLTAVRTFSECRPWVNFIAVLGFIFGGLSIVLGMLWIIWGSRIGLGPLVAAGLFMIVWAMVVMGASFILLGHTSAIAILERTPSESTLVTVAAKLKTFWVYVSIVLIVVLTLLLINVIVVFSTLGTKMPWE